MKKKMATNSTKRHKKAQQSRRDNGGERFSLLSSSFSCFIVFVVANVFFWLGSRRPEGV
jgi:hypothetical protein